MSDRRIFVSHCGTDRDFANQLIDHLLDHLDLDARHILTSHDLHSSVGARLFRRASPVIPTHPVFIAVLSPDALASIHTQEEIHLALTATHSPHTIHIFVVVCQPCEVPADLDGFPLVSFIPPAADIQTLQEVSHSILRVQWQDEGEANLLREIARLYTQRHFVEAAILCEYATQHAPKSWRSWSQIGLTQFYAQRPKEAERAFDTALALVKPLTLVKPWPAIESVKARAWLYANKSLALRELNRLDEALAALDESLRLDRSAPSTWANKSVILDRLKRHEDALIAADYGLSINANHAISWNSRGLALSHLKRYDEAVQAYDRAISLSPNYAHAWMNKAITLTRLQRNEDALVICTRAAELTPKHSAVWVNLGFILGHLDLYDEALRAYEHAVHLDPNNAVALNNKGVALYKLGRPTDGMLSVERAIKLSPDNPVFLTTRGEILLALGHTDLALAALERAITLDPDHTVAWQQKTIALHKLGYHDEAREAERRAADLEEQP